MNLERECHTFGLYLIGQPPGPYIVRKFVEYHAKSDAKTHSNDTFDRFLTNIALRNLFWMRLADVYASRFHKQSALRKKLILMLALLECSPGSFEYLDGVDRGGIPGNLVRLAWRSALYISILPLAMLLFLPVRAWLAVARRNP